MKITTNICRKSMVKLLFTLLIILFLALLISTTGKSQLVEAESEDNAKVEVQAENQDDPDEQISNTDAKISAFDFNTSPLQLNLTPEQVFQNNEKEEPITQFDQRARSLMVFLDLIDYANDESDYSSIVGDIKPVGDTTYIHPRPYNIDIVEDGTISFELDSDPTVHWEEEVSAGTYAVYNLIPYEVYTWAVKDANGTITNQGKLMAKGNVRVLNTERVNNARDLGGWDCDGGTVKYNMIFRGAPMEQATEYDKTQFQRLGLCCELDIRGDAEAYHLRESPIPRVKYVRIPIYGYDGGIKVDGHPVQQTKKALELIIKNAIAGQSTYFHCAAGADRTGTLAYLLEGLLGVSASDLDKDYELTSFGYVGNGRMRSNTQYRLMKAYMESMPGDTLEEKFINWYLQVGFDVETLNSFRSVMTNGEPKTIVLDSRDNREKIVWHFKKPDGEAKNYDIPYFD